MPPRGAPAGRDPSRPGPPPGAQVGGTVSARLSSARTPAGAGPSSGADETTIPCRRRFVSSPPPSPAAQPRLARLRAHFPLRQGGCAVVPHLRHLIVEPSPASPCHRLPPRNGSPVAPPPTAFWAALEAAMELPTPGAPAPAGFPVGIPHCEAATLPASLTRRPGARTFPDAPGATVPPPGATPPPRCWRVRPRPCWPSRLRLGCPDWGCRCRGLRATTNLDVTTIRVSLRPARDPAAEVLRRRHLMAPPALRRLGPRVEAISRLPPGIVMPQGWNGPQWAPRPHSAGTPAAVAWAGASSAVTLRVNAPPPAPCRMDPFAAVQAWRTPAPCT